MLPRYPVMLFTSAIVVTLAGCADHSELVDFVTFEAGIPNGAEIVAVKKDSGLTQDGRSYLIFDSDAKGTAEFADAYSGGVPIDKYLRTRFQIKGASSRGTFADVVDGISWNLGTIRSGRYFRRNDTNGFVAIDVAENRVYVFR